MHEKQKMVGEVMRTGRNEVVLSDPGWNRIIMGSKFAKVSLGFHTYKMDIEEGQRLII